MEQLYFYKIRSIDRVLDGDTVDAFIDLGFETYLLERIRFVGINAPEKHGATKRLGEEATAHLEQLLQQPGKLFVHSTEVDKFGRVLGTLYLLKPDGQRVEINQAMIDAGHALPYDGGKRSDADFLTPEFLRGREAA